MTKNRKSIYIGIVFFGLLFGGSYLWRRFRDNDIKNNSRFTFGKIFKKTGSLTSGEQWHYKISVRGNSYEGYRSTHVDYNVSIGDFYLVNFSNTNPSHSKILYDCKLKKFDTAVIGKIWSEVPTQLVVTSKK